MKSLYKVRGLRSGAGPSRPGYHSTPDGPTGTIRTFIAKEFYRGILQTPAFVCHAMLEVKQRVFTNYHGLPLKENR